MDQQVPITIDVFSDVVCPWCYIGERRLEQALAERPDVRAEIRWRPFQLNPDAPAGGQAWEEFAREKFGGLERAQAMFAQVAEVGR
ncbi:MAG TPA: DsbA family protein, partial [Herpetosiphonaceae bacterium]|nr:DsbA family protein [Herpetosiphonaceae bacterium]